MIRTMLEMLFFAFILTIIFCMGFVFIGCTEYNYYYDKGTNIQVDPLAEVSPEDMQTLKEIMHKHNVSTVIYYGVDVSTK